MPSPTAAEVLSADRTFALPKAEVVGSGLSIPEWLEARMPIVGASEISAVLNINPYETSISLHLKKRRLFVDDSDSDQMYWGRKLEQPIREAFTEKTGIATVQPTPITLYRSTECAVAGASPDGFVVDEDTLGGITAWYEGKCTDARLEGSWDDGVPLHYEAQAQFQLAVSGLPRCFVAVLIGGNRFKYFVIEADPLVGADLFAAAENFMDMVAAGQMPAIDGAAPTTKALKGLKADLLSEEVVELPDRFLALRRDHVKVAAELKTLEEQKDAIENEFRAAMGDKRLAVVGEEKVASWPLIAATHVEAFDKKAYRRLTISRGKN